MGLAFDWTDDFARAAGLAFDGGGTWADDFAVAGLAGRLDAFAGAGREGGHASATRPSSAPTRLASDWISWRRPRTSSSTLRSSIVSRMRAAAWATSSTSARVRFCVPAAPSLVAWNVRSMALRTASTASAASEPFLSFFLFFLAMAQL